MIASMTKTTISAMSTMALAATIAHADVKNIPTVKETIRKGEIITEQNISWIKPVFKTQNPLIIADAQELVGKQATRTIRPGAPVPSRAVRVPPTVNRSEDVTLRHVTAGVSLQMTARALEDGAMNQKIRVLNTSSGRILTAEVIEPGLVQLVQ